MPGPCSCRPVERFHERSLSLRPLIPMTSRKTHYKRRFLQMPLTDDAHKLDLCQLHRTFRRRECIIGVFAPAVVNAKSIAPACP